VAPEYPLNSLEERACGFVTIGFVVNTKGEPVDLQVVEAQPANVFDQAAVNAVKCWRYEPQIVNNVPTDARHAQRSASLCPETRKTLRSDRDEAEE
jgi:TonB family protein